MPVASFTITKLRWLRDAEPGNAARVAAVALPHDWLTWRLRGFGPAGESPRGPVLDELVTDRSDASGTGYWNPETGGYDRDLLIAALGHDAVLPRVLGPDEWVTDAVGRRVGGGAGKSEAAGARPDPCFRSIRHQPAHVGIGAGLRFEFIELVLGEVGDLQPFGARDAALERRQPAGQELHQSGLAVAIGSDQRDPVVVVDPQRQAPQHRPLRLVADGGVVDLMPAPTTERVLERMKAFG